MIDIELQTYWNVEILYHVFYAVASVMSSAGFEAMLKYVLMIGIALGIFAYAGNRQLEMAKWFIQALVFISLLNLPIARVTLTDRVGIEPPRVVDNVPFVLAAVAQANNLVFGHFMRAYEIAFDIPDDLGLQKGDVGVGHRILKQVNNATIRDPGLRADLMQFIKECTLSDVRDGEVTPQQIVGGTDMWNVIFNNTSPARFVTYNTLTNNPTTDTCLNVAAILEQRVDDAVVVGQNFYGKRAFPRITSVATATGMFVSTAGTAYNWILNSSSNASDALKQSMFNSVWQAAGTELPALLSDPARVSEVGALAGAAHAARQADGTPGTLSLLAQETLPHIRNWIEAIIYGIFPILVVLMVVLPTNSAKKVFGGYLMSLAWIGLWPVLFAMINHLSLMHLRYKARALELAAGVPFQLSDAFDATLTNEQSTIGYMVVLVPFIAGAVIRSAQDGFMSVSGRMLSGFASAGSVTGSGMESGGKGRAGHDTALANATAMNTYDGDVGLSGGGMTVNRENGLITTRAVNGAAALRQRQNQMLTQIGLDNAVESSQSQDTHRIGPIPASDQLAHQLSDTSRLTGTKGDDNMLGNDSPHGAQTNTTKQDGSGGRDATSQSLGKNVRGGSNFNTQGGALGAPYIRGKPDNRNGGNEGSSNAVDSGEERPLADSIRQSSIPRQNIDQMLSSGRVGKGKASVVNASSGSELRETFSFRKELTADSSLCEKVAARNGMTAMRFANQPEDRIRKMISDYVSEKDMVGQSKAMPQQTERRVRVDDDGPRQACPPRN